MPCKAGYLISVSLKQSLCCITFNLSSRESYRLVCQKKNVKAASKQGEMMDRKIIVI